MNRFAGISELVSHTGSLKKNCIFYVLGNLDIKKFLPEIEKFAVELVVDSNNTGFQTKIPKRIVEDCRKEFLADCQIFYRDLFSAFSWFGVTGTKGKTTIAYLFSWFLEKLGAPCLYLGTIGTGRFFNLQKSANTTPGLNHLVELLIQAKSEGIREISMEVSSQGLLQHRVPVEFFQDRMFTDLSEEHLDCHKTMGAYFLQKSRFFEGNGFRSFLLDRSEYAKKLPGAENAKFYGLLGTEIKVLDVNYGALETRATILYRGVKRELCIPLQGFFNLENILGILCVLLARGYFLDRLLELCSEMVQVPGRMEKVCEFRKAAIFVDYAHSSQSLEFVLKSARERNQKGRLLCVFGCGGDRDPLKRPKMGKAASLYCHRFFITSDNPRTEDPKKIMEEIRNGILHENYEMIEDRSLAISSAISELQPEDVLIVCGKGHETTQIFKDKTIEFCDRNEILKYVQLLS